MPSLLKSYKTWGFILLFVSITGFFTLRHLSSGPDRELSFERSIGSPLTAQQLDPYLSDVSLWPDWFYSTTSARIESDPQRKRVRAGDRVAIVVDPKKGKWKRFEIHAEVTAYEPGKRLQMKVIEDTKGRLSKMFDTLVWEVSLAPATPTTAPQTEPALTTITGKANGFTKSWRSRLFGVLTERILMAQVYYPNVIALSEKGSGIERVTGGIFPN